MSRFPLKQMAGMTIGAIAMLALAGPAMTQEAPKKDEVFKLTTAIAVPVTGQGASTFFSFDISWVDPVLKKYFLADRNNKTIDVVDPTTHQITQFINPGYAGFTGNNDTSGPDGVLTVPKANTQSGVTELWVGDSPGRVWVINATNGTILTPTPISVGGTTRADELCFDANDNLIMIASPGEDPPFVTFISTKSRQVVKRLTFDGGTPVMGLKATNGLEQCGWSPKTGLFYQNVPENSGPGDDTAPGAVAVIDPKTLTVVNSFPVPIDDCAGPQGMAIGPHNQILLGCNAASPDGHRNTVIINANSGAVLATFADLGGADQVGFNEGDGHYFIPSCNTACRAVPSTGQELLGVVDSNGHRLDQSVVIASTTTTTGTGAARRIHSTAADPDTNQVFLPIPAIGGVQPTYAPTICSSAPKKVGSPTDAGGCIAIFATTHDDRSSVAEERGADAHQE